MDDDITILWVYNNFILTIKKMMGKKPVPLCSVGAHLFQVHLLVNYNRLCTNIFPKIMQFLTIYSEILQDPQAPYALIM